MNDTMSSPSSDWARYYQRILPVSRQELAASNGPPNTSMGTTTTISSGGGMTQEGRVFKPIPSGGMTQEGRISKPIRKRSRIYRQTPTTLLSTTTTNFKAMVQQFTGDPIPPFASVAPYPSGANINFGLIDSQPIAKPNKVMVPRVGYSLAQLNQMQQYRHQQYMLPVNSSGGACSPVLPSFNKDTSQFSYM